MPALMEMLKIIAARDSVAAANAVWFCLIMEALYDFSDQDPELNDIHGGRRRYDAVRVAIR